MAEDSAVDAAGPAEGTDAADKAHGTNGDSKTHGTSELHIGRVKSYNFARGFGFLECPELHGLYSRDIFMRAEAVEELTLSRIASGSGPEAVKQRGNIFVCFSLLVNEAGNPEAQNVVEVKLSEVPEELHQQFPEPEEKEPKEPKAKPKAKAGYKGDAEVKEKETKKSKDKKKGKLEGLRVGESRVVIGQDAQDNWNILSAAKGKHWFFHLTDFPSCYVILECNDPTMEEKLECARLCRDNTKHKLSGAVKVDVTQCGNVKFDRKRDVVGECDYRDERKVEVLTV